jgi:hypothetical protein
LQFLAWKTGRGQQADLLEPVPRDSAAWDDAEAIFTAGLNNQLDVYNAERTAKKQYPLSFRLTAVWTISHPSLRQRFEEARNRLADAGCSDEQLRLHRGYHGTAARNIDKATHHHRHLLLSLTLPRFRCADRAERLASRRPPEESFSRC